MRVYLDNAATTPLDREVLEAMLPYLTDFHGNPSSIHTHGREVRSAIEKARKTVAQLLNTSPSEIFFTSGGTEADNTAIRCSVEHLLDVDGKGYVDLNQLESLLTTHPNALVSLMHANNEIGNLTDLQTVGELCRTHGAVFHSDTVQTMGHYRHDLQKLPVDFIVGAAHKFHGPKGVGFLYVNANRKIHPLVHGGSQERNMRGGTENVYGIIGLAKALEIAYRDMDEHRRHIQALKTRMMARLRETIEGVTFNGDPDNTGQSLYTVLNVSLPPAEVGEMLLFNLDIHKISASGGSACTSGSQIGSHVLRALNAVPERASVRFSFS
ncbi:MAG: cysteine desulfurase, partial [Cytophagales bacterium]|nr:cysteine desulfurase [Cytophagales bacterium]